MQRVIEETCRDIKRLCDDPALCLAYDHIVIQSGYYRPPGVYAYATPGIGRPILYRFPQPCHILEVLAAIRGGLPLETDEEAQRAKDVVTTARAVRADWLQSTANIARILFLTCSQTRLLYHLLTPLYTNASPANDRLYDARAALYDACGYSEYVAANAQLTANGLKGHRPPCRIQFWGTEVREDEL